MDGTGSGPRPVAISGIKRTEPSCSARKELRKFTDRGSVWRGSDRSSIQIVLILNCLYI